VLKVFKAIVVADTVLVVDILTPLQWSAYMALHDQPVLQDQPMAVRVRMVVANVFFDVALRVACFLLPFP